MDVVAREASASDRRERRLAYHRERYRRLKAAGVCVTCAKASAGPKSVSRCDACLESVERSYREKREALIARGLCAECEGAMPPDRVNMGFRSCGGCW